VTIDSKREQWTQGAPDSAPDEQARAPVSTEHEGHVSKAGYGDFFARVAHDLRSPLGIVMHVLQRLEADLGL